MPSLIDRLVVKEKFRDALVPLTPVEQSQLDKNILDEEGFLDPILYHLSPDTGETVVDGHHRLEAWKRYILAGVELSAPATKEVTELSGADDETVIKWIRAHQKGRRNQPTVKEQYEIGQEVLNARDEGVTSAQYAAENDITPSQARHAASLADAIEKADPEVRDQILADENISVSAAKEKAINLDQKDPSPLMVFEAVQKSLATLSRSVGKASGVFGENAIVVEGIRSLGSEIRKWEDECAGRPERNTQSKNKKDDDLPRGEVEFEDITPRQSPDRDG